MNRFKFFIGILVIPFLNFAGSPTEFQAGITSPDGNVKLLFSLENHVPYYQISYDRIIILKPSSLGFHFKNAQPLDGDFKVVDTSRISVDNTWKTVWGTSNKVRNHYNQLTVKLKEKESPHRRMNLIFRAYNSGVGFRYELPKQENLKGFEITKEDTRFRFANNYTVWWQPADYDSYESLYKETKLSEVKEVNTPITMKTKEGLYIAVHEANLTDYAGMTLVSVEGEQNTLESKLVPWPDNVVKVKASTPHFSPWRTIQIGRRPGDLIESNLIINLNEPCALNETSWIKPMKYMGIWWGMHIGKYTWFKGENHGATTENAKKYIDFAGKHGIPALLVEGWNVGWEGGWKGQNYTTSYDDYNLKEIVEYGRKHGVKIIAHNETGGDVLNYENQIEEAFSLYEKLGIPAVKTGYAGEIVPKGQHHHGQWMVNHYRDVVKRAAKHHLMIDAHEPIKPTGIRRTYPNMMAREGVRGQEFNAWSEGNPPEHTTILPFTRMLAGPLDYTPGIFDLTFDQYRKITRVHSTLAKQLALYVVLYSPLQMAADLVENYENHPAFTFIENVPVDWDETHVLNSQIGDFVTIARRKGKEWFIGSITDENCRLLKEPLSFLSPDVPYLAYIYADAKETDLDKNPTLIEIDTFQLEQNDTLWIPLAKGGGMALQITPMESRQIKRFQNIRVFNRAASEKIENYKTSGLTPMGILEANKVRSNIKPPAVRPGIDPFSWNGAVFVGKGESIFGIRVGLLIGNEYITGKSVYDMVNKVGPRAPDGSYARISFGKEGRVLTLTWSVQEKGVIVGSVSPSKNKTTIALEAYLPWNYPGKYSIDKNSIIGTAPGVLTEKEAWFPSGEKVSYFRLTPLREPESKGTYASNHDMISAIKGKKAKKGEKASYMKFTLNKGDILTFKAAINSEPIHPWRGLSEEDLLKKMEIAREKYVVERFKGSGPIGKVATAIGNEELWMLAYQMNHSTKAQYPRTFAPAGRPWVWGDWTTFGWDPMFQSAILSMEDKNAAFNNVFSTFASQLGNGMIPNYWNGNVWKESEGSGDRSQPQVASYFVWKLYKKFHSKQFLKLAYPALLKWFNWWLSEGPDGLPLRDGNKDSLLEWGSSTGSREAAGCETGMDDSPMWDDVEMKGIHMNLNSVWLNSLRALDAEMMSKIAEELGKTEDAKNYRADYEAIKKRMNEKLWNEEVGMYLSCYWNGEWEYDEGVPTITPANFTTLLAGIPSEEKARRMVQEHLLDRNEFWGRYVIPTINKNHPDYKSPYTYWRGTIWPPTNYLVYEGLKRYQFDKVAAELAQKSTELWLGPWEEKNWACENYNPETGRRSEDSHKHQGWSMNLPLTGIQELIDVEAWSDNLNDIRFGSLGLNGTNELKNVSLHGYTYDIIAGPEKTVLSRENKKVFEAKGGRILVRNFKKTKKGVSFTVKNEDKVIVKLYPPVTSSEVEGTIPAGVSIVEVIDNEMKIHFISPR